MRYRTKRTLIEIAYLLGISTAMFSLGWMWGNTDTIKGIKENFKEPDTDDKDPDPEEHPAIEWAEGGEEEFYKALEEADKEEKENESEE